MVLRQFRDEQLLTNEAGRVLVNLYYTYSPPVADFISKHTVIKMLTRWFLTPIVLIVSYPLVFAANLLIILSIFIIKLYYHIRKGDCSIVRNVKVV